LINGNDEDRKEGEEGAGQDPEACCCPGEEEPFGVGLGLEVEEKRCGCQEGLWDIEVGGFGEEKKQRGGCEDEQGKVGNFSGEERLGKTEGKKEGTDGSEEGRYAAGEGGLGEDSVDCGGYPEVERWFLQPDFPFKTRSDEVAGLIHLVGGFLKEDFVGKDDVVIPGEGNDCEDGNTKDCSREVVLEAHRFDYNGLRDLIIIHSECR